MMPTMIVALLVTLLPDGLFLPMIMMHYAAHGGGGRGLRSCRHEFRLRSSAHILDQ
jgi:hypothetical protein